MRSNALEVVELAYRVDVPHRDWVCDLLRPLRGALDFGEGIRCATYDASNLSAMRLIDTVQAGDVPDVGCVYSADRSMVAPGIVDLAWAGRSFHEDGWSLASEVAGWREQTARRVLRGVGVRDYVTLNALAGRDWVCRFQVPLAGPRVLSRTRRQRLEMLARHLTAAHRLRRRLSERRDVMTSTRVVAVLTPDGRVTHARDDGRALPVRQRLREAVVELERCRRAGPSDDDATLSSWPTVIDKRWTFVDRFEADGRRFVVAFENPPGYGSLSRRERAVAEGAARGQSNKEIAYDLGIAEATVRVLVWRASTKLAVRTRAQLVEALSVERGRSG
jgi:DNA-binding CsgD family transcriptional regulator